MKNTKEYYSVGEVSKICNIPANTLRFYDKIGLICPDKHGENNYRFYSKESLAYIPVIKYYKQMGFSLEEIKEIVDENSFMIHEKLFKKKFDELKEINKDIYKKYAAIEGWLQLITEAELIRKNDVRQVSVKYVEPSIFCCMEQNFNYNYKEAIINIDFTNYIESIGNEAAGVIILNFPSINEKLKGEKTKVTVMQKPVLKVASENHTKTFGGQVFASCYHMGPHETIEEAYQKIYQWASMNQYACDEESYERFLLDYWTTQNSDFFVTEVLVKVEKI
ncbi:MerR family transcriptional regulator [Aminipila terrae]|uniref:MerR family transcriptional regulator n=1 Tax=Aminipila terrae TaxID=2697030 RepID=A0A6P1MCS5_9FIRM|nr:MerR family transcriptional regulator [Aminipila terrae]QHI72509.1 MerR family transcriptional regulator [Aminipila terrae]